ncbi:MAG: ABC transporter [Firmicutes bacterium ZCTH02-B6]|nr:MAG: ABC transporter [Firmicutes bacterium ZCTH02-B6]
MNALISARGLTKRYAGRLVVNGIDLDVFAGEVLAVIGPNGAGKSTTLEMLLGLRIPDAGTVTYWTADPRREMGVQLQNTPFFPGLTAAENLQVFASFYGLRLSDARLRELLSQCRLEEVANIEAARLSGGQQKRLAIAAALVHNPKVVFLDEPTAALDPLARHEIRNVVRRIHQAGTTMVFTSHDMEEVEKLAERVIIIAAGAVVASGTPGALTAAFGVANLEELYLKLIPEVVGRCG